MVAHSLPSPTPRRMSRAEYDRMGALGFFEGERVELVFGTVVTIAPIGPRHASVVDRLNELLVLRLVGKATVRIQQPLVADHESEPQPDIAVVPKASYSAAHPDRAMLVIEVAESSLEYDRDTKASLYALAGVAEYWVIDVVRRSVEVHRDPQNGQYTSKTRLDVTGTATPASFPEVGIAVGDLFD